MDVDLTPELEKFVRDKVATGRYASAGEVVSEGLRMMEERDRRIAMSREDVGPPGMSQAGSSMHKATDTKALWRMRLFPIVAGIVIPGLIFIIVVAYLEHRASVAMSSAVTSIMSSTSNAVVQEAKSPDNGYVATLGQRSSMNDDTYEFVVLHSAVPGYYLDPDVLPSPPDEVARVASEGLVDVRWKGSRTLVVDYAKGGGGGADFMLQARLWRGVTIVYHRVS